MKTKLQENPAVFEKMALDPRWWLPILLLGLIYVAGPQIYQRAIYPTTEFGASTKPLSDMDLISSLRSKLDSATRTVEGKEQELAEAKREVDAALAERANSIARISSLETELNVKQQQIIGMIPSRPTAENPVIGVQDEMNVIKHFSSGDRERIAEAFHDLAIVFDDGNKLFLTADLSTNEIFVDAKNGVILDDVSKYSELLRTLMASSRAYLTKFDNTRPKWKYYERQIGYIVGNDPENNGIGVISGAISQYQWFFERWSKIQNKKDPLVIELFQYPRSSLQEAQKKFQDWRRNCEQRLGLLKDAV